MGELARTISDTHALEVLAPRGLKPDKVSALGVYSVTSPAELPAEFQGSRYATIPGLVFPWNSPQEGVVLQYRPDEPVQSKETGHPVKYVFPGGSKMVLNRLLDPAPDAPLLLQEGTCQSLAAALYAPRAWAVYGMSGCWSWRLGDTQVAIPDLMVAEGREVIVSLDADAATNLNVYNAGLALAEALMAEGAQSVKFLRLGGHGAKAGLDDVLGSRPEDKRAPYLARLVQNAKDKPADAKPKPGRSGANGGLTAKAAAAGRPMIVVNEDRHEVINQMTNALQSKWDGTELFDFGGVLARRKEASMEPVTEGIFADLIAEAAMCVSTNAKGDATYAWPDGPSMKAVLSSRVGAFSKLDRVSESPFVRADGTICQTSGYDEASSTFLVLDEAAEAISIPEEPTEEDVAAAVKLLCVEWLGDLFDIMPDESDRANALGLVLTPLIRGLIPLVPMAVVDGLQMGVGKNLVSDCLAIFATGRPANPLPYSRDDEENRKVITASFRQGHELFVFDEAHVIEGRNLARAITGLTYSDRVLGVSNMAEFPNRITWVALGNNVQINGDLSRRVYRIRLAPRMSNPQDRDASSFRHPDLKGWTAEHRAELLAAGLTLVRAWMAGDRVENEAGRRFGSFEQWGGMVGGILDAAGVPGFLGNLTEWRSESDYEATYWTDHFRWLRARFGTGSFAVSDVVSRMRNNPATVEHPPRLEDHTVTGYSRMLGQSYGRMRNRTFDGLQLTRAAVSAGHGNQWQIVDHRPDGMTESDGPVTSDSAGGSGGSGTSHYSSHREISSPKGAHVNIQADAEVDVADPPDPPEQAGSKLGGLPGEEARLMAFLAPLAVDVPAPICPDCERTEEPVPPDGFWFACPSCHPATFTREV